MPPSKGATKEERATKARFRASQLETGADYAVICKVIKDDPKTLASRLTRTHCPRRTHFCERQLENCGPVQSRHREAERHGRGRGTASPELHHLGRCAASALRVLVRSHGGFTE